MDLQEMLRELPNAQHRQYQWINQRELRQMLEVHDYTKAYFSEMEM
jgi:hypothetical protein